MTSEEKQKFKDDLMSVGILHWHKGPALGGRGDLWEHDDQLLIIAGPGEIHFARIEEHDGKINVLDANGDEHVWRCLDEWSYWARITPQSLPAEMK